MAKRRPKTDDGGSELERGGDSLAPSRAKREVIAVTGGSTFLGRNLVGLLEEDPRVDRIVVLDVKNAPTAGRKTTFYDVDLTQPGVESRVAEILHAERVETLAHLAFVASPTQATAWAHELESVGTMHVLDACRKHDLRKLVVRSNTLVYGPNPTNPNFLDEGRPMRGLHGSHFVDDRIDVERQVEAFAHDRPDCCVTVLRMATLLGPTVDNYATRWLSRRIVPTVMGFDPLVQFVHEVDAVAAVRLAIERRVPGAFNIVGEGVLPISTVVKLAARLSMPIPYRIFRQIASLLWVAQLSEAPPAFVAMLRYLCVADGRRAREELGFVPLYTSRDAVLDFEGALRLREAHLLQEARG
ncbi:MAG: NAD-dependent epimerase/dehydratase family protein [Myxococcales bacterium]|jgi:UDP-glucose 4-epimerase